MYAETAQQASRKEAARNGIQEAISTSRIFDLKAAIEEGENVGLSEGELSKCRKVLAKQEKQIVAREMLERALVDHDPGCLRKYCCCMCESFCCCNPSTAKMDALFTAVSTAEAAGLKEVEMSEAKQALALEMLYHAQLIPLSHGARHKYEEVRKAVQYAEKCDAEELPILRAKVVMEEAHSEWTLAAKARLQRAIDDDDIPPAFCDTICAGLTCGFYQKKRPEFHKIRALKIAIREGEDAGLNDDELEEARLELQDVQGDVTTRMNILEDKMFQLEAQMLLQDEQPGCCWRQFSFIYDIFRTIPVLSILSFVLAIFGFGVIVEHTEGLKSAVEILPVWDYFELGISNATYLLFALFVVDAMALIVAFPAAGATREWIFGRKNTGTLEVLQCLLGPCTVGLILVAVAACFIVVLAILCVLLPYMTILGLGSVACTVDPPKTNSLATALTKTGHFHEEAILQSLSDLCKQDYWTLFHHTIWLTIGLGMVVASQAWTQCLTVANLQKIWMQTQAVDIPAWARPEQERQELLKLTSVY